MPRNVKGIGRTGKKHKKPASRPCGWAARSRCHRVPASAGARYFRGRRHLPLLGPRRRSKLAKINTRRADRPPHPALRMPQPPRPPHARIPHLPATLHRPRAALHTSLPPHPLLPSCAQELNLALLPRPGSSAACRGGAAAVAWPVWAGSALVRAWGERRGCAGGAPTGLQGGQPGANKQRMATVGGFLFCQPLKNPRR